ncbi:MAG: IS4 family transposase, partial [Candidatus Latescibacteria bacterium]|nr:IS4 family transposase [Candidatus Latescibacterota bacterium]
LSMFPWARFRRAKGGVKVHVLLDHDDYMPSYVLLTQARRHDRVGARLLNLNPGSIVAMDRAYNDYQLFADWTARGIHFVTRLKANADYYVVEHRQVPKNSSIRADQVIRLLGVAAQKKCPQDLRRVVVWDKVNECEIVLLTNHMDFGATTVADIYKDRWEIELFFKTLKQHL